MSHTILYSIVSKQLYHRMVELSKLLYDHMADTTWIYLLFVQIINNNLLFEMLNFLSTKS